MAIELLTTSQITSLVNNYKALEVQKLISPLTIRKSRYESISSAYTTLSSKLNSLKSILSDFKATDSSSVFANKTGTSSNIDFLTVTAGSSAVSGAYSLRVNQLARNDLLISGDINSDDAGSLTGTHTFTIKTGDGSSGEFLSNVEVDFSGTETKQEILEKLSEAINDDKAVINSGVKINTDTYSGGAGSFVIDLNGTETVVSVNGGGTYEELIDEIVENINGNVSGVVAEKVVDAGDPQNINLKLTVSDNSKYISVSHESGFDLVSDLNISASKEKAAAGTVTATAFSPITGKSQFSISSKESGLDYRIKELSDDSGSSVLASIGLNLGTSRPVFDQTAEPDTAGYVYADITAENNQLNARINFNSLNIQRNSNTIGDLVEGVTFNLKSVMQETDSDVSVSVANDVEKIKTKISDFITKFNDVYTYIRAQRESIAGARGFFSGDGLTTSLMSTFSTISFSPVEGLPVDDINYLNKVGITFDPLSGLSISDNTLLTQNLEESVEKVEALFNSENGYANQLYNAVEPFLGSGGYIANLTSSYQNNVNNLKDKITSVQTRIDKGAEVLRSRYEELQMQIAALLSSSSMLGYISSDSEGFF